MPRVESQLTILQRRIQKSTEAMDKILEEYDVDTLKRVKQRYTRIQRSGETEESNEEMLSLKPIITCYKKYYYHHQRKVKDLKKVNELQQNNLESCLMCVNCKRHQIENSTCQKIQDDNDYITFIQVKKVDINRRYKFRNFSLTGDKDQLLTTCSQCHKYLTLDNSKVADQPKYVWPSFFWNLLANKEVQKHYGPYSWKILPITWRRWWLKSIEQIPIYRGVSMNEPEAFFVDKTTDLHCFNDMIDTGNLSCIAEACNKFLFPTVLCPWG